MGRDPGRERTRRRILEPLIAERLETHGGVLITGPKAVGKTTTARTFAASEVRLDQDRAALTAAQTDPRLVLDGPFPRLLDEYRRGRPVGGGPRSHRRPAEEGTLHSHRIRDSPGGPGAPHGSAQDRPGLDE